MMDTTASWTFETAVVTSLVTLYVTLLTVVLPELVVDETLDVELLD